MRDHIAPRIATWLLGCLLPPTDREAVLGGYVAAWIRPGAAQALAGIEMIVVVTLMVTMTDSPPLWYGQGEDHPQPLVVHTAGVKQHGS